METCTTPYPSEANGYQHTCTLSPGATSQYYRTFFVVHHQYPKGYGIAAELQRARAQCVPRAAGSGGALGWGVMRGSDDVGRSLQGYDLAQQ